MYAAAGGRQGRAAVPWRGVFLGPEDVTDEYGAAALARFYREIEINRHKDAGLGMPELERMGLLDADRTGVKDHFRRNVNHFLNRIMVLPVEKLQRNL